MLSWLDCVVDPPLIFSPMKHFKEVFSLGRVVLFRKENDLSLSL